MQSHFKPEYFGKLEDATLLSEVKGICEDQVMSGRGCERGTLEDKRLAPKRFVGGVGGGGGGFPKLVAVVAIA